MDYKSGYVYHIKDEYFAIVQDDKLMRNKESGNFRPTYYCIKDEDTGLLWVVPMSSRVDDKYKAIHDKQVSKYGNCLTIILGTYDDKKAAFLLQNMFPITQDYLHHIHTKNNNPVPVTHSLQEKIKKNMQQIKRLHAKGHKLVFPDITRLEKLMIAELQSEKKTIEKPSMKDRISAAKDEADRRNSDRRSESPPAQKKDEHDL